ncbi:EpsG family protein [Chryseobacterium carnipullorum]|uniref:EpsG family protein n=1 Tax=Chryseobacterium carnipullorum TaxID=1124835 RepID=UPI000E8D46FD|nr:EpsG family protein [Chryseobacterium carnipullorum]HBV14167.1 hypothetical protein [Chryseobacterium carnipullorum]
MIGPFFQNILYFSITFIAGLYLIEINVKNKTKLYFQNFFYIILAVSASLLFGLQDGSFRLINDIGMYRRQYDSINNFSDIFLQKTDFLFYFIFYITKKIYHDFNFTLSFISLLYNIFIYLALKKISKNYYFLFFILLSFFFYYNLGSNVLRQGLGFSFYLYGVAYFFNNNIKKYLLYSIIALGFHFSFFLPIFILLGMKYFKKLDLLLLLYTAASIVSLLRIKVLDTLLKIPIIAGVYSNRTDFNYNYYDYKVGFRPDFFAFNTFFLILFYFTYKKIISPEEKFKYYSFLGTYIILSAYFFLMFEFPFSDRYGILSWVFIPILFYPYINKIPMKNNPIGLSFIYFFCVTIYIIFNFKT